MTEQAATIVSAMLVIALLITFGVQAYRMRESLGDLFGVAPEEITDGLRYTALFAVLIGFTIFVL
jgi:site-specific recombinase